jgi:hypothetical protein
VRKQYVFLLEVLGFGAGIVRPITPKYYIPEEPMLTVPKTIIKYVSREWRTQE